MSGDFGDGTAAGKKVEKDFVVETEEAAVVVEFDLVVFDFDTVGGRAFPAGDAPDHAVFVVLFDFLPCADQLCVEGDVGIFVERMEGFLPAAGEEERGGERNESEF